MIYEFHEAAPFFLRDTAGFLTSIQPEVSRRLLAGSAGPPELLGREASREGAFAEFVHATLRGEEAFQPLADATLRIVMMLKHQTELPSGRDGGGENTSSVYHPLTCKAFIP